MTNCKQNIYWTLSYPSNPESFITWQHHLLFCQLINQMVLSNTAQLCFSWRGACSHFFELCVKNSATSTRFTPNPGCPVFVAWTDSERVVCTAYKMWCIIFNPHCVYTINLMKFSNHHNSLWKKPRLIVARWTEFQKLSMSCSPLKSSGGALRSLTVMNHTIRQKQHFCTVNTQNNHNITYLPAWKPLSCVNPWLPQVGKIHSWYRSKCSLCRTKPQSGNRHEIWQSWVETSLLLTPPMNPQLLT